MKNKIRKNYYLYAVTGIIIAVAVVIMFGFARVSKTLESNQAMVLTFRKFQQLNHNINESMLRSRSFLLETYDPLVANVEQAKALCSSVTSSNSSFMASDSEALTYAANSYCLLVNENLSLVEKFKSKNSILKNSVQYLPTLVKEFEHTPLEVKAQSLLSETLRYSANPTPELKLSILNKLDEKMSPAQNANKPRYTDWIQSLYFHVKLVMKSTEERSEIETEILSAKIDTALSAFEGIYQNVHEAEEKKLNLFYFGLCILCTAMGLAVFMAVRKLQTVIKKLNDFNENLENKVSSRTQELEEKQQMLLQSTKMSVIGELSSGIAHEINNPLALILLNAELTLNLVTATNDAKLNRPLETIIKSVERISKIVAGLRRFTRDSSHDLKTHVSLLQIVEDGLSLCAQKMKKNHIELKLNEPERELIAYCIPQQITQVLLNLLNNSVDAVLSQTQEPRWIQVEIAEKDLFLELSITDSGPGISPLHHPNIMQPYFTTKDPGKSLGLSLSISRGVIENHQGNLNYDAKSQHTRFVIRLPLSIENRKSA
ncbi:MAG: GHKL domain-containing protein [Bdellovibrionaceae bacterium]|nr:GHKL domain-containing protein [Pseudobdellovibrionaceae bacterium]